MSLKKFRFNSETELKEALIIKSFELGILIQRGEEVCEVERETTAPWSSLN